MAGDRVFGITCFCYTVQCECSVRKPGFGTRVVTRIENGERRVDAVELVVLARALGVVTAELLTAVEAATPLDHRI
jgi:hypothetical protein